jgi:RNA polymerase sigma factor (sigma-70 family)
MLPFDPSPSPSPVETSAAPQGAAEQKFTTAGGVQVIVKNEEPPKPTPWSERHKPGPKVYVLPPGQSAAERDACMRSIYRDHERYILEAIRREGGVAPASAEDVLQCVVLVVCGYFDEHKRAPDELQAYLGGVVRNEVRNHNRLARVRWRSEAEMENMASRERSPEGVAELHEFLRKVGRYLEQIPPDEADVVRMIDGDGLSPADTAKALGRPFSTVAKQRDRGRERIRELALESERATALGARRRG